MIINASELYRVANCTKQARTHRWQPKKHHVSHLCSIAIHRTWALSCVPWPPWRITNSTYVWVGKSIIQSTGYFKRFYLLPLTDRSAQQILVPNIKTCALPCQPVWKRLHQKEEQMVWSDFILLKYVKIQKFSNCQNSLINFIVFLLCLAIWHSTV